MASLGATSLKRAPVASRAVASRPYGVSSAGRSIEPPRSTDSCQRPVGVIDPEIDGPVGGNARRQEGRRIRHPGEHVVTVDEDRVAELRSVAHHAGVPAEDLPVERQGALVVPGLELEPARGARLAENPETLKLLRLPRTNRGPSGVAYGGHRANVADVHGRHDDVTAIGLGRLDRLPGVVSRQMNHPCVRHARTGLARHGSGDRHTVLREHEVPSELRGRLLRLPAEQLAVKRPAAVGVRCEQVDPAWCS